MLRIEKPADPVNATLAAVCKAAQEAAAAGLCIIPPSEDGQKRPWPNGRGAWDRFKTERPTPDLYGEWYPGRSGMGMVTGSVSGNAEAWDFDDRPTYEAFIDAARHCGLGDVIDRIEGGYCDDTAGGGVRWIVRYPNEVKRDPGKRDILARRRKEESEQKHPKDRVKVLIEMPSYSILAPTNGKVHPSCKPYIRRSGGFATIESYTAEERAALVELARSFDRMAQRADAEPKPRKTRSGKEPIGPRPGDEYAADVEWDEVLVGWRRLFTKGEVAYWCRPGKRFGISATTNFGGHDKLHVFTSSTELDADKSYGKFAAYAVINHGGDFGTAAKALKARGYGAKPVIEPRAPHDVDTPDGGHDPDYRATKHGIEWKKRTPQSDVWVRLSNFTARIVTEVTLDDVESRKEFEIVATLRGREYRLMVPASQFSGMNWVTEKLGARAFVEPGQATAKRAAVAIQVLSGEVPERTVYTNTGWKKIGGEWAYLHAGGATGPLGPLENVDVELPRELAPFILLDPDDGEKLKSAVLSSIGLLKLAPIGISANLLGCAYRSVLGGADMNGGLIGPTGNFKTAFAVLVMQHFGAGFDDSHIPANWSNTANHLEELAFIAKDALLLIDEYMPGQVASDRAAYQSKAERVLRNQGNKGGRGRMGKDRRLVPSRPPRGLIFITGEELPEGTSLRARIAASEVPTGCIDPERLSAAQALGSSGAYALAMAGFVKWLAPQLDDAQTQFRENFKLCREKARTDGHKRTAAVLGQLMAAWHMFLSYASDIGAVTDDGAQEIGDRVWQALIDLGAEQSVLQDESDPIPRFRELVLSSIRSGRSHLVAIDDPTVPPPSAGKFGWVEHVNEKTGEVLAVPKGNPIGWVDEKFMYLDPPAAFKAANDLAVGGIGIGKNTLARRLVDAKVSLRTEKRGGKRRLDWRLTLGDGRRPSVWVTLHHMEHAVESVPSGPSVPELAGDEEFTGHSGH